MRGDMPAYAALALQDFSCDGSECSWLQVHWRDTVDLLCRGNHFGALNFVPVCPPVQGDIWSSSMFDKVRRVFLPRLNSKEIERECVSVCVCVHTLVQKPPAI